jgi:hypothetical protein
MRKRLHGRVPGHLRERLHERVHGLLRGWVLARLRRRGSCWKVNFAACEIELLVERAE